MRRSSRRRAGRCSSRRFWCWRFRWLRAFFPPVFPPDLACTCARRSFAGSCASPLGSTAASERRPFSRGPRRRGAASTGPLPWVAPLPSGAHHRRRVTRPRLSSECPPRPPPSRVTPRRSRLSLRPLSSGHPLLHRSPVPHRRPESRRPKLLGWGARGAGIRS